MSNFTEWAQTTSTATRRCKVCQLPPDWYEQVLAARAQGYGAVVISHFLQDNGMAVSVSSIQNHFIRGASGHER